MPSQPPSFGSREYWDTRFTVNAKPFEWLEAPTTLDPYLVNALKHSSEERPQVLHIGCGTSLLSHHLRAHIKEPEQIHNLDYSDVAIRLGREREFDLVHVEGQVIASEQHHRDIGYGQSNHGSPSASSEHRGSPYMRWSQADLLSPSPLLAVCKPVAYSVSLDKSTSDSIACAEDLNISLPYPICTNKSHKVPSQSSTASGAIHPINLLAIHLALLAKPRARWIALSYSEERFPFLSDGPEACHDTERLKGGLGSEADTLPQDAVDSRLPDPSTLWTLVSKHEIEKPAEQERDNASVTHRPKVLHWVYVLECTKVPLFVARGYGQSELRH